MTQHCRSMAGEQHCMCELAARHGHGKLCVNRLLFIISVERKAVWCTVITKTSSRQFSSSVRQMNTPTSRLSQSRVRKLSCYKWSQHAGTFEVVKYTSSNEWKIHYAPPCGIYIRYENYFWQMRKVLPYRGADKSLVRPGRKQAREYIRDARDINNIETRDVIKFLFLQGNFTQILTFCWPWISVFISQ